MKKETIITYDDNDYKLLSRDKIINLPDNPCDTCSSGVGCCGCPDKERYSKAFKPYKEASIDDIALKLCRKVYLQREILKMQDEINSLDSEIPNEFLWD